MSRYRVAAKFIAVIGLFVLVHFPGCSDQDSSETEPIITFSATFGWASTDIGYSVQQTSDGGYIIGGWTNSFGAGDCDVYLIKTDRYGHMTWSRTFGGPEADYGHSVRQLSDGGYVIAGETHSFGAGSSDIYLIRTDENGHELWSRTYGGESEEWGMSVQESCAGGFIMVGSTYSYGSGMHDVYLIKTDDRGNELWSKIFGGVNDDQGWSVQETNDRGYIITGMCGFSHMTYKENVYLIKTDDQGNELWSKMYGGKKEECGMSVQQTVDNGYIILGRTKSYGVGYSDFYLIKTDELGNECWSRTFGGEGAEWGYSVQQIEDGFILIGSKDYMEAYGAEILFIKTDERGNELWTRTFGGYMHECGYSGQQTSDGGYIIVGGTNSFGAGSHDVYMIKTDQDGNI
ncbi:hypothetical protein JXQ70_09620 [bacterium]|nr:hypothetical protein [bacterium]